MEILELGIPEGTPKNIENKNHPNCHFDHFQQKGGPRKQQQTQIITRNPKKSQEQMQFPHGWPFGKYKLLGL